MFLIAKEYEFLSASIIINDYCVIYDDKIVRSLYAVVKDGNIILVYTDIEPAQLVAEELNGKVISYEYSQYTGWTKIV